MSTNFLLKSLLTEGEGDGIKSRLPFKIFSTLNLQSYLRLDLGKKDIFCSLVKLSEFGTYVILQSFEKTQHRVLVV